MSRHALCPLSPRGRPEVRQDGEVSSKEWCRPELSHFFFPCKGQIVNMLSFMGPAVSVVPTQACRRRCRGTVRGRLCSRKALHTVCGLDGALVSQFADCWGRRPKGLRHNPLFRPRCFSCLSCGAVPGHEHPPLVLLLRFRAGADAGCFCPQRSCQT